jgi:hypothetical protein
MIRSLFLDELSRRAVLRLAIGAFATVAIGGHTPYGQWTVYRRRNLFIVASREDLKALLLARWLAQGLSRELPESYAKATRASDSVRIASLLATGQLDVAVLSQSDAARMLAGSKEYTAIGAVPIRAIADFGFYVVVAVESFKTRHAYLLAGAIQHLGLTLPGFARNVSGQPTRLPVHPGAAAYRSGAELPEISE